MNLIISFLLILCIIPSFVYGYSHIDPTSFAFVKTAPSDQCVVFFRESVPASKEVLKMVNKVAKKIAKEHPDFKFYSVNGDAPENKEEFSGAGFNTETYIFTSFPANEGIIKYTLPFQASELYTYIKHKYLPANDDALVYFEDEDDFYDIIDQQNKFVFVKFFETWCQHCKRLANTYTQAATYFQDKYTNVQFVKIECSKNEQTKAFCLRHNAKSFPTLMLFDGETTHLFENELRSIQTFESFITDKLGDKLISKASGEATSSSSSKQSEETSESMLPKKKKSSKSKKSSSKKQTNDDDAVGEFTFPEDDTTQTQTHTQSNVQIQQLIDRINKLEQRLSKLEQHHEHHHH